MTEWNNCLAGTRNFTSLCCATPRIKSNSNIWYLTLHEDWRVWKTHLSWDCQIISEVILHFYEVYFSFLSIVSQLGTSIGWLTMMSRQCSLFFSLPSRYLCSNIVFISNGVALSNQSFSSTTFRTSSDRFFRYVLQLPTDELDIHLW